MKFVYVMASITTICLLACNRADTAPVKRANIATNAAIGTTVIEPQFSRAEGFVGGLARVEVGEGDAALSGYIDPKGKFQVNPKYRWARDFADGLAAVNVAPKGEWAKWGYIDTTGKTVIEPQFGAAEKFEDGYAVVMVGKWPDGLNGLIDKRGRFVINPQYKSLYRLSKDRYFYSIDLNSKGGILDAKGKTIAEPQFSSLNTLYEGLSRAVFGKEVGKGDDKCGYVDADGKVVIEPQFLRCQNFSSGLARVGAIVDGRGGWGYIDQKGQFVIKPRFAMADDFHDGLSAVAVGPSEENAKWGFIDKTGTVVIEPQFDEFRGFENGLAVVRVGGGFGDQQQSETINALNHTTPLKVGKWGVIDKQGRFVVNPRFDNIGTPQNGLAPMRIGDHLTGKWGYIAL